MTTARTLATAAACAAALCLGLTACGSSQQPAPEPAVRAAVASKSPAKKGSS